MPNFFTRHANLLAAILLGLMTILAFFSLYHDSAIMDEIAHIPAGYSYLKFHDYRLNPEHPPLAKILAAAPLLFQKLTFPLDLPAWKDEVNGQWEVGWKFFYERGNDADQILLSARLPMLLFMILLGIYLFKFTKKVFNVYAALLALFLYAFSPDFIAHSRFVTTDVAAVFGICFAGYHFLKYLKKPSWKKLLVVIVTLSIAQLLKYSCFVLYPIFLGLALFSVFIRSKDLPKGFFFEWLFKNQTLKKITVYLGSFGVISFLSLILICLVYALLMFRMPPELQHRLIDVSLVQAESAGERHYLHLLANNFLTRPLAQYLLGLAMVFARVTGGNTTYFLGQTGNQGWWYFYPVAIFLKTPLPTLLLSLASLGAGAGVLLVSFLNVLKGAKGKFWSFYSGLTSFLWQRLEIFTALLIVIFFLGTAMASSLNIGVRHVMPLYPFWFMLCAGGAVFLVKKLRPGFQVAAFAVLLFLGIWTMVTNLRAFPSYLAYFNEIVGGPRKGYLYMVDSNLDWGQDLRRLVSFINERRIPVMKIDYFGGGDPKYYLGPKYVKWSSNRGETNGWLAVSATYFQNSKYYAKVQGEKDYTWLEKEQPVAIIGGSILVYDLR